MLIMRTKALKKTPKIARLIIQLLIIIFNSNHLKYHVFIFINKISLALLHLIGYRNYANIFYCMGQKGALIFRQTIIVKTSFVIRFPNYICSEIVFPYLFFNSFSIVTFIFSDCHIRTPIHFKDMSSSQTQVDIFFPD